MITLRPLPDPEARQALKQFDDATAALLLARNLRSAAEAAAFLAPSYEDHTHDPFLITDMRKAAERVAQAITDGERIAVWSDYDCDGIPGGVLFHDFLAKAGASFVNYIPHRHREGYGLNADGIRSLAADGVSLIVTIDCGIVDHGPVEVAQTLGIDVIITDHHLPDATLPAAYAVVDPKRADETAPFRDYCGAGLAWKLVCAVLAVGFPGRERIVPGWEKWLLDMAALATIADMVPLIGENRIIASYGLRVMRKSPRLGLRRLCGVARAMQQRLTEDDVAFLIAPRINAASRMGDPRDAFTLLSTTDEALADRLAKELERTNRSRRSLSGATTRAARERIAARAGELPAVLALGDPDWRPGLLGLVATALAQEYQRPVFLWGREDGPSAKGSCRSAGGVSVVDLMRAAGDTFAEFGGHAASGGFTVADDALFDLEARLCAAVAELSPQDDEATARVADAPLDLETDLSAMLAQIGPFAPFGVANPRPTYLVRDALVTEVAWFGAGGEHMRLRLARSTGSVEAICFFARRELGPRVAAIAPGQRHALLATLERDTFTRGQPVRLRIVSVGT
jgi:single-stranded-DNA-specific exonuclease